MLTGDEIETNLKDINNLKQVAMSSCAQDKKKISSIRRGISALRDKVSSARQMLSELQVIMSF